MLDQQKANDFFHLITWRSPLRRKVPRQILGAVAKLMVASEDPGMVALGTATGALVDLFERKSKGVGK